MSEALKLLINLPVDALLWGSAAQWAIPYVRLARLVNAPVQVRATWTWAMGGQTPRACGWAARYQAHSCATGVGGGTASHCHGRGLSHGAGAQLHRPP